MRFHTHLTEQDFRDTLSRLQKDEDIASDIEFIWLSPMPSRSHPHSYEVRLGTYTDGTNPYKDSGKRFRAEKTNLPDSGRIVYAAAYDEWGWLIANLFRQDPDMKTSNYRTEEDFHKKTRDQFR